MIPTVNGKRRLSAADVEMQDPAKAESDLLVCA